MVFTNNFCCIFQFQSQCSGRKVLILLDICQPFKLQLLCLHSARGNTPFSTTFASWMLVSPILVIVMHSAKHSSSAIHVHKGQQQLKMRMDKNSKSFSYMLLTSPLMKAKDFSWLLCLSLYQPHYLLCSLTCHIFGRSSFHANTEESRAESVIQMDKRRKALPPELSLEWESASASDFASHCSITLGKFTLYSLLKIYIKYYRTFISRSNKTE